MLDMYTKQEIIEAWAVNIVHNPLIIDVKDQSKQPGS